MTKREENHAASEKFLESLRPSMEKLCRDVDNQGKAIITGFVFCQNPPCIAHLSTIDNKGDELIRLHLVLTSLMAEGLAGKYPQVTFKEFDTGTSPAGSAPEEIADELARLLLVTGADADYLNKIFDLAQQYLALRRKVEPPIEGEVIK
jgi:hypothetical protein